MRGEDVPFVTEIERRSYTFPWSEKIFRDCLRVGYSCWVYEDERSVSAYGVMSVAIEECHILNLCVRPEVQGRGLGRKLLRQLLDIAHKRGAKTAFLEVRPSNEAALHLYGRAGFNEVGVRQGYYPASDGREDAIVLAREL